MDVYHRAIRRRMIKRFTSGEQNLLLPEGYQSINNIQVYNVYTHLYPYYLPVFIIFIQIVMFENTYNSQVQETSSKTSARSCPHNRVTWMAADV